MIPIDPVIRVRWDTSLRSTMDDSHTEQSQKQPKSIIESVNTTSESLNGLDRFSPYGRKAIAEAKKNGT